MTEEKSDYVTVHIQITPKMKVALEAAANALHKSESKIIRAAIKRYLRRRIQRAEPPTDLENLRATVATVVASTSSWKSCQKNLSRKGLTFVARGGGLSVASSANGKVLCKSSALGFGYSSLIKKFGEGFPGHNHKWLEEKVLGRGLKQSGS